MSDVSKIAKLIKMKLEGSIDAQGLAVLENWGKENPENAKLLQKVENGDLVLKDVLLWLEIQEGDDEWIEKLTEKTFEKIHAEKEIHFPEKRKSVRRFLPYAASLVLMFLGTYAYIQYQTTENERAFEVEDLAPGSHKALITLSDGRTIELNENQNEVVLGERLTYADGSPISDFENEAVDMQVTTPKGGQYQITLKEGTKIWLNSDSKLVYPSRFEKNRREIEIIGEAYVEVATHYHKGEKTPFIIHVGEQKVEVLGTQFNIKAYEEESAIQTTLVEGLVKVHAGNEEILLEPGEQSVMESGKLKKRKVDVDPYLAWKNDEFMFFETELKEAMAILARWYDFEVVYETDLPETHLYGTISRKKSLTEVLKIMETSGLRYKIENRENKNKLVLLK